MNRRFAVFQKRVCPSTANRRSLETRERFVPRAYPDDDKNTEHIQSGALLDVCCCFQQALLIRSAMKFFLLASFIGLCTSNPTSKPYIPFVTNPFDQNGIVHHNVSIPEDHRRSLTRRPDTSAAALKQCPLQFTLGLSRRSHHAVDPKSMAIVEPPTIYPVHPAYGPGRQVIHSTQYEHLDLLTPSDFAEKSTAVKEGLMQHQDFPLLFESSSFLGAPIVHDVNGDGIPDAIMADYDGGIYFIGLQIGKDHRRYFHRAKVPRLFVRRDWMEQRLNETTRAAAAAAATTDGDLAKHGDDAVNLNVNDPYHSYFEYGTHDRSGDVLRGVSADIMSQDHHDVKGLEERRKRKVSQTKQLEPEDGRGEGWEDVFDMAESDGEDSRRRLQQEGNSGDVDHHNSDKDRDLGHASADQHDHDGGHDAHEDHHGSDKEGNPEHSNAEHHGHDGGHDAHDEAQHDAHHGADQFAHSNAADPRDAYDADYEGHGDDITGHYDESGEDAGWPDDDISPADKAAAEELHVNHVNDASSGLDDHPDRYVGYDDYYYSEHRNARSDYYDEKHYMRLPPHILSSPVLADMKKQYSDSNEREEMIFVAVSYYFDEDEYEGHFSYKRFENTDKGDETEVNRGKYVASALVSYTIDGSNPRFSREEHLDLSGDVTSPRDAVMLSEISADTIKSKLGAFSLSPPTIADIDGNGDEEVILGTSMGMIYCVHARHMYNADGWPIQLPNPIESRILVEDVLGNTNLEIFVLDAAANVYCFDSKGMILWRRDLISSVSPQSEIRGLSPMTMGDVDGDGLLDIVLSIKFMTSSAEWVTFVVAISAVTGEDIKNFPTEFDSPLILDDGSGSVELLQKLPQPLLIDLHANQEHWKDYINRNGTAWNPSSRGVGQKSSSTAPQGGRAPGLHIVQPVGSNLKIIEGGSGCTQTIAIGEEITSMVQADDVHGTNSIDLVVTTRAGNIVTLESPAVPYHPLNVWNSGEVRGRRNNFAQGFSASQGIFVHEMSRQYRDIFGVYVPITFQIFDNRPNIVNEPDKRLYHVEIRDGTSAKRAVLRKTYTDVGVYTERLYINYGPGYYTITVLLRTTHGLQYEDIFHLGYNVHYMDGFALLLWLPLLLAALFILFCSRQRASWDEDGYDDGARGRNQGILGSTS